MVPSKLEQVQDLEPEKIQYFLEHRDSPDIPANIQDYILKLDCVARLMHKNNLSVRRVIEMVQQEFPGTTLAQARAVYYDALDYFYLDDRLSARSWDNVYAEQFEDMKRLAIAANKLEIAYKCAVKAHELRTKERESKDVNWTAPVFLISTTVSPESLGFKSQKLADIAHRNEDEKLREMIMGLATTDAEKARMLSEAGIKAVVIENQPEQPDEQ